MHAASPRRAWEPYADVILTGGRVITVDPAFSVAEALAIKGDRIIAVGSKTSVDKHRGPSTRILELNGRTAVPGLQDSHNHFLGLGHDVAFHADLSHARDAGQILERIAATRERLDPPDGAWLLGNRWDQNKYPAMVTRWDLDRITGGRPVRLNRTYRGIAVNTEVFRLMGIRDEDPRTWPDWWLTDPAEFTGEDKIYRAPRTVRVDGQERDATVPTGVFLGARAVALITAVPPPATFEEDVDSVRLGCAEMLRLGVTSVVDPSSRMGYHMRVYQEAYNRGWITLRISAVYEGTFTTQPPDEIRERFAGLRINNLGDAHLRWRGSKFYGDGGVGSRSSWMSEPFVDAEDPDGRPNFGNPVMADYARREAQFRAAFDHGWDLHTHSCGDQAMRQTVDLYMKLLDEVRAQGRPTPRWSVIHAYMAIEPKTRVIDDMARYGIVAAANPVFNWQQGLGFATALGEERMARCQPFRSYVQAGVVLASGSDYPVTSHDPWHGMYALLTRRDQTTGKVFGPDETLGVREALRSYTINGAYLTYEEDFKGSLEVGKVGDVVVLDLANLDDLQRDPELCFQMSDRVLLTMVGGEVRYQKSGFHF